MLITDEEYIKIVNIFERDNAGRYLNDINASNEDGETLLYRLAAIGAVNLISLLVKLGCDINLPNNDGRTPVSIAVMKHHEDTVAKLVELGASLDTPDNDGRTIVHLAAITGDDHALKMLFKYNVKMDTVESLNGATPVFIAAYFNHENVLLRLLDQGVNIETPHMNGTTPLNIAAEKGFVAIMRHLIDNYAGADGANLEAYDEKGRTPVVAAAANDHLEAVKLLLENGADLNASTDSGSTALYIAASNGHVNIVRYLLRHFDIQIIPTYYSAKALEKLEGDDENKRIKIAKLIAAKLSVGFNIDCIPVYPYEIAEICGRDEVVLAFQEVPHTLTMYPSDPSRYSVRSIEIRFFIRAFL